MLLLWWLINLIDSANVLPIITNLILYFILPTNCQYIIINHSIGNFLPNGTQCFTKHSLPLASWNLPIVAKGLLLVPIGNDMQEARRNVLEKNRLGRFRRNWKTLFVTVAMNQVNLLSVIIFCFSLSHLFHVHNDSCLASLCGGRYFRRLVPNTAPFVSEVDLRKCVLASELFVPRPCFIHCLTAKRHAKILWQPLQFILWRR